MCSSADISGLTPAHLVAFLQTHSYDCVNQALWTFNSDVSSVLSNAHLTRALTEISNASPAYQGDDQQHLLELLDFVHAAYYHKVYHPADQQLFDPAVVAATAFAALDAFIASPHANDATDAAGAILFEWLAAVDSASIGEGYYTNLKSILHAFNADPNRAALYEQGVDLWTLFHLIQRAVFQPAFVAKIDQPLIDELRVIAVNRSLVPGNTFLVTGALTTLGAIVCQAPAWKAAAVAAITDAYDLYPPLSEPSLWAVSALECNNWTNAHGVQITKAALVPQVEALLFPNTWSFDDGALVVRTPLSLDRVQVLYHAIKQVESQFNRITETIAPLPDDPNPVLKVILHGSRADYRAYQSWLYGTDTNNGGIYIEQDGTFYTYDRTLNEDSYTLEELFRHELSHYLVGRFLIEGLWGATPIYDHGRMVWFDEGFAEFLAWSTSTEGVKTREHLVALVQADGNDRMTVGQVLHAAYGDFKFYRYAGLLFTYWYHKDIGTMKRFIDHARAGDGAGFDGLVNQLSADVTLEKSYQQYLDGLVATIGNLDDPHTTVPPLGVLDVSDPAHIQALVRQTRIGYLAECTLAEEAIDRRFSCRGQLSGPLGGGADPVAAWHLFDSSLNELLNVLLDDGTNNFHGASGRFGRIRFIDEGGGQVYPEAEYFVDGPLGPGPQVLQAPAAQVQADFHSTRLGINAVATLNGPIVECRLPLTSQLYDNAVDGAVLSAALDQDLQQLRDDVYAIRPSYYRDFQCAFDGPAQVIQATMTQKYMLRDVLCHAHVP